MRILPILRGARLLGVCLLVLLAVSFCHADVKEVEVVGFGECADCKQSNIKASQAFSGLRVKIECKTENGKFKTRGIGALNEGGKFLVSLPNELVKEECFAKLHSADSKPCPSPNGVIEGSKIVLKTKTDSKHTYVLPGKLKFSPVTCTSATFWPPYRRHPLFPGYHPLFKPPRTPTPVYEEPVPPQTPINEEPVPPQTPVYKEPPQTPVYEQPPQTPVYEQPPQTPVYEQPPKTPVYEQPPQTPVYEQPVPPQTPTPVYEQPPKTPTPVYEQPPKTPVYEQPPKTPVYEQPPQTPVYEQPPQTPVYKQPPQTPVYEQPVPPQTPVYFKHPKLPPLPPYGYSHP